ncbi:Homeobox domain-containing protein [Aphelenchoides besseyi]|nr:Homeobox domain-containing protein [Aphelenchoides besseyi]
MSANENNDDRRLNWSGDLSAINPQSAQMTGESSEQNDFERLVYNAVVDVMQTMFQQPPLDAVNPEPSSKRPSDSADSSPSPTKKPRPEGESNSEAQAAGVAFREARHQLKLSQPELANSLNQLCGTNYSTRMISDFENGRGSSKSMKSLKESMDMFMAKWKDTRHPTDFFVRDLKQPNEDVNEGNLGRTRRHFTDEQRSKLKEEFAQNEYPQKERLVQLAEELGLQETKIRVWFSNHRQMARRRKQKEESEATTSGINVNDDC